MAQMSLWPLAASTPAVEPHARASGNGITRFAGVRIRQVVDRRHVRVAVVIRRGLAAAQIVTAATSDDSAILILVCIGETSAVSFAA